MTLIHGAMEVLKRTIRNIADMKLFLQIGLLEGCTMVAPLSL